MKKIPSVFAFTVLILCFMIFQSGCKKDENPIGQDENVNHKPVITEVTANPANIKTDDRTSLFCKAADEDGDTLKIIWSSADGIFPNGNTGPEVVWISPSIAGSYKIKTDAVSLKDTVSSYIYITVEQIATIPAAPLMVYPSDKMKYVEIAPKLKWARVKGASSYTVDLSKDPAFTSGVLPGGSSVLKDSVIKYSGLEKSTTYYWRVSSSNLNGSSGWSQVRSFTTGGYGAPCPGLPTISLAGKTYNTVQIGEQCWLKENIDAGKQLWRGQPRENYMVTYKHCYKDDTANCTKYGALYNWRDATDHRYDSAWIEGICPYGWHVATIGDFDKLLKEVGYNFDALKAEGEGTGTNASGFSALMAGWIGKDMAFNDLRKMTFIWAAWPGEADHLEQPYYLYINSGEAVSPQTTSGIYKTNGISVLDHFVNNDYAFSVRCVKD